MISRLQTCRQSGTNLKPWNLEFKLEKLIFRRVHNGVDQALERYLDLRIVSGAQIILPFISPVSGRQVVEEDRVVEIIETIVVGLFREEIL